MTSPAMDRIDRMLPGKGKQTHPFDWVNLPIFYDPEPEEGTEYTERLRAATKFAYVAANEMSFGVQYRFRPSSMSNGPLAYNLAEDYADKILQNTKARFGKAFLTTQNLKANVASTEMMSRVIFPNREEDFRAANQSERTFPDDAIVVPIEFENVPRTQRGNHALSRGSSFQDWTFETWWAPRVIDAKAHIQGGGRTYSRYANIEDMTADAIQCGFLDDLRDHVGPGKDYDVTDEAGNPITLADRAWDRARHIVDVTERGFHTDLAVATLMAQFQIDEWLRHPEMDGNPIDFDKVHDVLKNRSKAELARMDDLKALMLPYIAEKCMDQAEYKRDPNLKIFIENHIETLEVKAQKPEKIKEALFAYNPVGAYKNPDYADISKSAMKKSFGTASQAVGFLQKSVKRRSTEGNYFQNPSKLFDDNNYNQLSQWEQAALPFAMGAIESFRLPENAPVSMFYVAEPKGGSRAKKYMKDHDVEWLKEAYSQENQISSDDSFYKKVIQPNVNSNGDEITQLVGIEDLSQRGVRNVVSSMNFINIAEAAEKYRMFVAAEGPQKFSPRARFALMVEWLDRNPQAMALRKDWTTHHDEVQLALRGLMIATGLVERPFEGGNYRMEIFQTDLGNKNNKLIKMDMGDMILSLGQEVDRLLNCDEPVPAREHYVSMARLLEMFDMYTDPLTKNYQAVKDPKTGATQQNEIIAWKEVDPSLMAFVRDNPAKIKAVSEMRDHIREQLITKGVQFMNEDDLDGLGDDFSAAWSELHGFDAGARRKRREGRKTDWQFDGPV